MASRFNKPMKPRELESYRRDRKAASSSDALTRASGKRYSVHLQNKSTRGLISRTAAVKADTLEEATRLAERYQAVNRGTRAFVKDAQDPNEAFNPVGHGPAGDAPVRTSDARGKDPAESKPGAQPGNGGNPCHDPDTGKFCSEG